MGFDMDLDGEEEIIARQIHESIGCVSDANLNSPAEQDGDENNNEEDNVSVDDVQRGINEATVIAKETFEFIEMEHRNNHCHCQLYLNPVKKNKERCINQFTDNEQDEIRLSIRELTAFEKDLILLGMVCFSLNDSKQTMCTKHLEQTDRSHTRIRWFYYGHKQICGDTFIFLMETSKTKITKLKHHYVEHGLVPMRKKTGGVKNNSKKALTLEDTQKFVCFILNFHEEHGIVLPGRIPGFTRTDIKVLPSEFSKARVWRLYRDSALKASERAMGLSTFRKLWIKLVPYVVIAKPASDLCWTCQKNNSLIIKNVNVPEEEKTAVLKKQEEHLFSATAERSFYRQLCAESKVAAAEFNVTKLTKSKPCSKDCEFHYSFDFAQQVHYPCDPMQPGPIYFKTPRKCGIFGVNAEGLPAQVNYLIDEASACGKGANVVISLLHHFLETYGIGETELQLNADNCSGQNKNNVMMQYLCWRTLVGLHHKTSIHFLLAGHTKFAPDWCFGLLKRTFRKTFVSSLTEMCNVVERSTEKGINMHQVTGDQDGKVIVKTYDWVTFLTEFFRKFPGLKSVHHFSFEHKQQGVLKYKQFIGSEEKIFNMLKKLPPHNTMPEVIIPKGLDDARKAYLFKEIREFCKPGTEDLVCPKPPGMPEPVLNDSVDIVAEHVEETARKRKQGNRGPAPKRRQ